MSQHKTTQVLECAHMDTIAMSRSDTFLPTLNTQNTTLKRNSDVISYCCVLPKVSKEEELVLWYSESDNQDIT